MICADLEPENLAEDATYSGSLSYLAGYTGPGYGKISGSARLGKTNTLQTQIAFSGSGFGDLAFNAHLHARSCADDEGGVR